MTDFVNGLWCPECGKIPEVGGCDEDHLCFGCGSPIIIRSVLVALRTQLMTYAFEQAADAVCLMGGELPWSRSRSTFAEEAEGYVRRAAAYALGTKLEDGDE